MRLFNKKEKSVEQCILCGKEIDYMGKIKLNDGNVLCRYCEAKTNTSHIYTKSILKASSLEDIKKRIEYVQNETNENKGRVNNFTPTYQIGQLIWFDDTHNWFSFPSTKVPGNYIFKYDELIDFNVIEDGQTISKGSLGKALVGGAVFGVAGAIAGGMSKKTKDVCNLLSVTVMTTNYDRPTVQLVLIPGETLKSGIVYNTARQNAEKIAAKLTSILEQKGQSITPATATATAFSSADEIKKFKELLDLGVLTQEEFDAKKKELLGL